MYKYDCIESYVMCELKEAHDQISMYQDDMQNAANKIISLEAQLINQASYIRELEEKLNIKHV